MSRFFLLLAAVLALAVSVRPAASPAALPQNLPHERTVLDRDHEFDAGSPIALSRLSPIQISNLATLGHVWGFLKYHHPRVTAGALHWDYELFRVMPAVLAAPDRASANEVLSAWIDRLGPLPPGLHPALPSDLSLSPDLGWLDDRAALGSQLCAVHAARPSSDAQFYLTLVPGPGNPVFAHELAYPQLKFPDPGYQLLALFRFWNVYRYWSPYRDLVEGDWDATLAEFIPRFAAAADLAAYQRALFLLIARVHDSHANLWSALPARPPQGTFHVPALFRFVEGRAAIFRSLTPALQRGDVLLALDGTPLEPLLHEWAPYYAASNDPTLHRNLARNLGTGPAGAAHLRVQRVDTVLEFEVPRVPEPADATPRDYTHDLPGPAFRLLSPNVAYLKLSTATSREVDNYLAQARGTKGWIVDLRNYPSDPALAFRLGAHFVEQPTPFARPTQPHVTNPGCFAFDSPVRLPSTFPFYSGKLVILVDEVTQSNAEFTAMAFRAAPGAVVIGSTTAGADGNISRVPLPGGQHTWISGLGVYYPDKRPTQRVGIVPDVDVCPTLSGLRAGRDEVLEAALRRILGPGKSDAELRQLIPTTP